MPRRYRPPVLIHSAIQRVLGIQKVLGKGREVIVGYHFRVDTRYVLLSAFKHPAVPGYRKLSVAILCLLPHEACYVQHGLSGPLP